MRLEEAFEFNPKVKLPKGTCAPRVEMADLKPFTRSVRASEAVPFKGGSKFMSDDILMARITPSLENGKTSIYRASPQNLDSPASGSTEFTVIRARPGVSDPLYAYYVFTSADIRDVAIASMTGSSGRQRVQIDTLKTVEIDLPSVDEQREISRALGLFDEKIESNERAGSWLLELASSLYLRALDEGDCEVEVAEIAEFHNRRRVPLSSAERADRSGDVPYYGATGIFGYVDEALFDEVLVLVGEDGSVVREDGGPVLQYIWGPAWINNHAHALTGVGISNELLYLALDHAYVRPIVTGAAQPKVNMRNLKSLVVKLPRDKEELERRISFLFASYRRYLDETAALSKLRDALHPELISGRLAPREIASIAANDWELTP